MNIGIIVTLIVSGFIVGFVNTLAGGGSVISMTLFMMLGLPPAVANGTNRIAVFLQNLTAVAVFKKNKVLTFQKSIKYVIPVALGSVLGSNIVLAVNETFFNYFFIGVILIMVLVVLLKPQLWLKENPRKINRHMDIIQWMSYVMIGIYGGFIHVGIGYFLIAMLVLVGGYDLLKANAIKNLIVLMYVPFSLIPFILYDQVRYDYGLIHAIGNIIGAFIASNWATKLGNRFIRYILIFLMLVSCIQVLNLFDFSRFFTFLMEWEK
ncbi:MAG: sulfite exporter TauE/SafE family protein [Bacteroidales bacterium]|jgi:uncharacterized membrane protein YfcA|nr:sulfite exporter TauE/SafE family protein [Bacteroidales bacterium]MDD3330998.1 sulfite exporter TauE/SafE family protein [Bacteroidales bacterium]MDD3692197.1 sulfite exporter TauE/SafE family protein [Bacteroidales bacterium]MDD4044733.1 sulfite exporter TauE/SafE family protein [Bacteroidales bacterium]MDD4581705.1 sulfite exporter TauE/SafE family protein [Bacteroidales bacterium]